MVALSNKPDIDDIKEKIAEMFAWCDSGAAVDFRHRKFAELTLQALYTRLASEAVKCPWEWDGQKGWMELIPLSKLAEIMGQKE